MPSQDGQTYLATTLDAHVRLMDAQTGKMLNDFTGHANMSYRCRACFGHGEASVICGDEKGTVWAWDLLDVCFYFQAATRETLTDLDTASDVQGKPLQPNPPPKVHDKVITWVDHHPIEAGEMITASADGTVKVWRHNV